MDGRGNRLRSVAARRRRCRSANGVLDEASRGGPPDGEAVHYFFDPFSREVFAEVLNNLVVSYRKRPRRLYLILIEPVATDLIDNSGVFQRLALPLLGDRRGRGGRP